MSSTIEQIASQEYKYGFVTDIEADTQEVDGPIRKLRGHVRLERTEMVLYADEVDFNAEANYAEARGNVHYKNFLRHEEIFASKVEYYLDEEKGTFYFSSRRKGDILLFISLSRSASWSKA